MSQSDSSPLHAEQQADLRIGMIGCGQHALLHIRRLAVLPGVRIVGLCDPNVRSLVTARALVAGDGNGPGPACHADYSDMLAQVPLDAVCINSPNPWHVEQVLASLEHGLHVLCEKPLTLVPDEVDQVVAATRSAGRVVSVAYQSRYRRDARLLRRVLQAGTTGRVTSVSIFGTEDWITPNRGTWRHDPERCPGGFFGDANGHQLDLLFWLTGLEAETVRASMEKRGTPVPMVTWGEARLRSQGVQPETDAEPGVPFTFLFAGDARRWREEINIQTEGADFALRDTRLFWTDGSAPLAPYAGSSGDADLPAEESPDTAFIAAVRGGPPVLTPPDSVWPVLRFTRMALASARSEGVAVGRDTVPGPGGRD